MQHTATHVAEESLALSMPPRRERQAAGWYGPEQVELVWNATPSAPSTSAASLLTCREGYQPRHGEASTARQHTVRGKGRQNEVKDAARAFSRHNRAWVYSDGYAEQRATKKQNTAPYERDSGKVLFDALSYATTTA